MDTLLQSTGMESFQSQFENLGSSYYPQPSSCSRPYSQSQDQNQSEQKNYACQETWIASDDNGNSLLENFVSQEQTENVSAADGDCPRALSSENGLSEKDQSSGGEKEMSSRGERKSRWDPLLSESSNDGDDGSRGRKRKSRWADDQLPEFCEELSGGIEFDPEIQALNVRLIEICRNLQSGWPLDDRPEGARSPSPEPVYDSFGHRTNTRECRARDKLNRERLEIISQIIKKNPAFKPSADYRPPKLQKKLNIPVKEFPGVNFIGSIIGPRGNTQKDMERETGAKIVIRGRGSVKEGKLPRKRNLKLDPSDNDDLHVFVEAETQESLEAAVAKVEKLLQPGKNEHNEHKMQQLRELAALNGTIRDVEICRLCGESGHRQYACPSKTSAFKSDVLC